MESVPLSCAGWQRLCGGALNNPSKASRRFIVGLFLAICSTGGWAAGERAGCAQSTALVDYRRELDERLAVEHPASKAYSYLIWAKQDSLRFELDRALMCGDLIAADALATEYTGFDPSNPEAGIRRAVVLIRRTQLRNLGAAVPVFLGELSEGSVTDRLVKQLTLSISLTALCTAQPTGNACAQRSKVPALQTLPSTARIFEELSSEAPELARHLRLLLGGIEAR